MSFPTFSNFNDFTYLKTKEILSFKEQGYDEMLFGKIISIEDMSIKDCVDMLILSFILNNIPEGSKLLEIGGGISRVLSFLNNSNHSYELWNLDKFDGCWGYNYKNQIMEAEKNSDRFVLDYIGEFSKELPDNYFDFIFSNSVLEHLTDQSESGFRKILYDIKRIIKDSGHNLHCIDITTPINGSDSFWMSKIVNFLFENTKTFNEFIHPLDLSCEDMWFLSEHIFNERWRPMVEFDYPKLCGLTSIQILW